MPTTPYTNRRFGVEIECKASPEARQEFRCYNDFLDGVVAKVREAGVEIRREGYNHQVRNHWKIVPDASLSGWALEVVSPPLNGSQNGRNLEDALDEVGKVAKALVQAGCTVKRDCGLHVHVEVADLSIEQIKNVFVRYSRFQRDIDNFMPRSRRGNANHFCGTMNETILQRLCAVRNRTNFSAFGRYFKVNPASVSRQNTVEFRQHSGTVNATKIQNWIQFCLQFTNASAASVSTDDGRTAASCGRSTRVDQPRVTRKLVEYATAIQGRGNVPRRGLVYSSASATERAIGVLNDLYGWQIMRRGTGRYVYYVVYTVGNIPRMEDNARARRRQIPRPARRTPAVRGGERDLVVLYQELQRHCNDQQIDMIIHLNRVGNISHRTFAGALTENTFVAYVSMLRGILRQNSSYTISRGRRGVYSLVHHDGSAVDASERQVATENQSVPAPRQNDTLWTGIDSDVAGFYQERAQDLG